MLKSEMRCQFEIENFKMRARAETLVRLYAAWGRGQAGERYGSAIHCVSHESHRTDTVT